MSNYYLQASDKGRICVSHGDLEFYHRTIQINIERPADAENLSMDSDHPADLIFILDDTCTIVDAWCYFSLGGTDPSVGHTIETYEHEIAANIAIRHNRVKFTVSPRTAIGQGNVTLAFCIQSVREDVF